MRNWIFLISKSIPIIYNKHVIHLRTCFIFLFHLNFRLCIWLAHNNICDNLPQVFIIKFDICFTFNIFIFFLFGFWIRIDLKVSSWTRNSLFWFVKFGVDSFSCFIFEDTCRQQMLLLFSFLRLVFIRLKIIVICEVVIFNWTASIYYVTRHFTFVCIIALIKGKASIEFSFFEDGHSVISIFVVFMKQIFLFLRN